jgi:hypothetical protein
MRRFDRKVIVAVQIPEDGPYGRSMKLIKKIALCERAFP